MFSRSLIRTTLRATRVNATRVRLASTAPPASSPSTSPSPVPTPTTTEPVGTPLPDLPPPAPLATSPPPTPKLKQPVGAFRGGLIGFLLGLTTLGSYGYFLLLNDYEKASSQLVESVKNLEESTNLISTQLSQISSLSSRLSSLESTKITQKQLDSLRNEYKKLYESQHLDLINLKAHVWSIEQDLVNSEKRNQAEMKRGNQTVTLRV